MKSLTIGLGLSGLLALSYLQLLRTLVRRGVLTSGVSRKLLHIGIGAVYMSAWRLYPPHHPLSRYVASLVPLLVTLVFAAVGLGHAKDADLVHTMSRSGDRRELLRGPLIYGVAHVLLTWVFWTAHPAGIVALCALCGGDGVAELAGKRFGRAQVPWAKGHKSWAGTLAFIIGGTVLALVVLPLSGVALWNAGNVVDIAKLVLVMVVAAAVETLPIREIDNATVTFASALLSTFLW